MEEQEEGHRAKAQTGRGEWGCTELESSGRGTAGYEEDLFLSYILQEAIERISADE